MVRVRFAPSPTGRIHIGNIRIAILNWLLARSHNGYFLLRMDDTDRQRSTKHFAENIIKDMEWLGLTKDALIYQSDRIQQYDAVLDRLKASGHVYPCYETPQQLETKRKLQLAQGRPPIYDRSALALTKQQKAEKEAEGIQPHWRFKLQDTPIEWLDMTRGNVRFEKGHVSDPVLVRADGRYLYTLSSVVDDVDMGITHIVRGEDHMTNTAAQVQLLKALGASIPNFAHMPLIKNEEGQGFSKRLNSGSIQDLREQGIENKTILAALAKLGTNMMPDGSETMESLIQGFNIEKFGNASPKFHLQDLLSLNTKIIHHLPYEDVKHRLHDRICEHSWSVIRSNLNTLRDADMWGAILHSDTIPKIDTEVDGDYIAQALSLLPGGTIDTKTWHQWIQSVKNATGKRGKALFMPLRLAITGRDMGPEMEKILPILGRKRLVDRLEACTEMAL